LLLLFWAIAHQMLSSINNGIKSFYDCAAAIFWVLSSIKFEGRDRKFDVKKVRKGKSWGRWQMMGLWRRLMDGRRGGLFPEEFRLQGRQRPSAAAAAYVAERRAANTQPPDEGRLTSR
jgi:hypothetical protein